MCSAQDHLVFLTLLILFVTICLLADTYDGPSLYTMLGMLVLILVYTAACLFCACLVIVPVTS